MSNIYVRKQQKTADPEMVEFFEVLKSIIESEDHEDVYELADSVKQHMTGAGFVSGYSLYAYGDFKDDENVQEVIDELAKIVVHDAEAHDLFFTLKELRNELLYIINDIMDMMYPE